MLQTGRLACCRLYGSTACLHLLLGRTHLRAVLLLLRHCYCCSCQRRHVLPLEPLVRWHQIDAIALLLLVLVLASERTCR